MTITYNEEIEFNAFIKEMRKILDAKSYEKKSWISCDLKSDILLSTVEQYSLLIESIIRNQPNPEIRKRAIHLANYCMMIWSLRSD